MDSVKYFVRFRSFVSISLMLLAMLVVMLAVDGVQALDAPILVGVALALFGLRFFLLPSQTEEVTGSSAFDHALKSSQRPTIVEFFSTYCVGCLAMNPVMEKLEAEAQDRIQIIRLNIDNEPGKSLMDRYGVAFTPTFVYFDAEGNKLRETVGVIDKARILYELEQA